MTPDLSVIIVAYNCRDELARCLESLAADPTAPEMFVIDNASRDATADMVRGRFPAVTLIANAENRGFAAANNQGLARATGRNVLFLNPDTVVHAGALAGLVKTLDADATIGACGPQLLNADGSVQPSARMFPSMAALLYQYTPLRVLPFLKGAYRRHKLKDFDFRSPRDVDVVMGAAFCVPRRVLDQVTGMDERFFVYLEEMDLAKRIKDAGYRVRFEPCGRITHIGGVSAATATANLYYCRSLLRYVRKHNGCAKGLAMDAVLRIGMAMREAILLVANAVAAGLLTIIGQSDRARRRRQRLRASARFLGRDMWIALFRP